LPILFVFYVLQPRCIALTKKFWFADVPVSVLEEGWKRENKYFEKIISLVDVVLPIYDTIHHVDQRTQGHCACAHSGRLPRHCPFKNTAKDTNGISSEFVSI
jgi:hypothetical protein